jgi:hypothetical protein
MFLHWCLSFPACVESETGGDEVQRRESEMLVEINDIQDMVKQSARGLRYECRYGLP